MTHLRHVWVFNEEDESQTKTSVLELLWFAKLLSGILNSRLNI